MYTPLDPVALTRWVLRGAASVDLDLAAMLADHVFQSTRRHPRPEAERRLLTRAQRFEIPFGSLRLAGWRWGSEGPKVLLVHGWEGRGAQLGSFVDPLLARGFEVVTFDAPAHGDSPGARTNFFHFADSVRAAIDATGPLDSVIAHSMGGATLGWVSRLTPVAERYAMIAPPNDLHDYTGGFARLMELDERVRSKLEGRLERQTGVRMAEARFDRWSSDQKVPLLVVHDEDDREVPVQKGVAIAAAWPGSTLVRTKGLGHRRILRDPSVIEIVTRFVAHERATTPGASPAGSA